MQYHTAKNIFHTLPSGSSDLLIKKKSSENINGDYLMQCGLKLLKEDKYVKHGFEA